MTIAIGIICNGGVVLGVDGQLSLDGTKLVTKKIHMFPPVADYHMVAAIEGHEDPCRLALEQIQETHEKEFSGRSPTIQEIRQWTGACLAKIFKEEIDTAPVEQQPDLNFSLFLAIRKERERRVHLFRTNRSMVVEVKQRPRPWWCMGYGFDIANYALDLLLEVDCTLDAAAQVVAYVIKATQDAKEYVGMGSDVHVIQNDGRHWNFSAPDLRELETNFAEFFKLLRYVISSVDASRIPDGSMKKRIEILERQLYTLRQAQRKRHQEEARQRAYLEGLPNPE